MLSQYIDALGALTVELRVIRELIVLYLAIFKLFPNSEIALLVMTSYLMSVENFKVVGGSPDKHVKLTKLVIKAAYQVTYRKTYGIVTLTHKRVPLSN